jgi:endonuclease I
MGWAGDPAYDPPAGYYDGTAELLGSSLQGVLNGKIKGHRVIAYGSSGTVPALRVLDAMPDDSSQVNLIYWGTGRAGSNYGGGTGQWNHEHLWPQSYGVSSGAGNSDLFELRPCDVSANSERGSKYFQEIPNGTVPTHAPLCRKTSVAWMPRPEEKGDIARAMFYMAVRYEGGEATPDLKLSDTPNAATYTFGRLSDLLAWHREDPVDEAERKRNHLIYTSYQFNRNPFVDDPDYAELVFRGVPVVRVAAVRAQAVEGGTGTNAAAMLVSRRGPLSNALTVTLSYGGASGTNVLAAAPMTVTIPAGTNAVEVVLAAASNAGSQGNRTLTVGAATNVAYAPVDGAVTLTVTDAPESGLSSWAVGYGLSGTQAEAGADPDGDGWSNAQEYAFGLVPNVAGGELVKVPMEGGKITYLQRSGVTYVVRSAMELGAGFDGTVEPVKSSPQPGNVPGGYEQYEATMPAGNRGFLKVEATIAP